MPKKKNPTKPEKLQNCLKKLTKQNPNPSGLIGWVKHLNQSHYFSDWHSPHCWDVFMEYIPKLSSHELT